MLRRFSSRAPSIAPSYTTQDPLEAPAYEAPAPSSSSSSSGTGLGGRTPTSEKDSTAPVFPSTYPVGPSAASFVDVPQLRSHLLLLAAFFHLRFTVLSLSPSSLPNALQAAEPAVRWSVFVSVAVFRTELYLREVVKGPGTKGGVKPPLDVTMCLHTMMLNPGRWDEDCARKIFPRQDDLRGQLLPKIAPTIDPSTLGQKTSTKDVAEWEVRTGGLAYDPIEHFQNLQSRPVEVLEEDGSSATFLVPWFNSEGTGYAQSGFAAGYGRKWTHDALGIAKLATDLVGLANEDEATLAGTGVSPQSARPTFIRTNVRHVLSELVPYANCKNDYDLASSMSWSRDGARRFLRQCLQVRSDHASVLRNDRAITNILSHYTRGEPFSLDLASAVLRQGTFIDKMHGLGWLDSGRFQENDPTLHRCVARYHAFMDLRAARELQYHVPTLDIDLAWHTHLLSHEYRSDCLRHFRCFLDHDDKIEEGELAGGFEATAEMWELRFGAPYTTCGCPLPPPPPPPAKKFRWFSFRYRSGPLRLIASSPSYPRSQLLDTSSASTVPEKDSTHPSEHNSLLGREYAQYRKHRQTAFDSNTRRNSVRIPSVVDGDATKKTKDEGKEHHHLAAFFAPMPLVPVYGATGYPVGGAGACAVVDADVVGRHQARSE
ncbi:hypothetical protein JCM8547_005871 [Rhodosporidiobolus lusitaniae]